MTLCECSFLVPLRRDSESSDGELHQHSAWLWLKDRLLENFAGHTIAPGEHQGLWTNPASGQVISDLSRKYTVALEETAVPVLREVLSMACNMFHQQCIYLSIAGRVEFVEAKDHDLGQDLS